MRLDKDRQRDPRIHQASALKDHKIFQNRFEIKKILNKNLSFPEFFCIHQANDFQKQAEPVSYNVSINHATAVSINKVKTGRGTCLLNKCINVFFM